jgi:uncharacterized protein (TIGR00730 family)
MKPTKTTDLTPAQKKSLTERMKTAGTYSKAYEDMGFMSRKELRAVRLQLELLKPEMILREHKIRSTIVVFGSARVCSPEEAQRRVAECEKQLKAEPKDAKIKEELKLARLRVEQAKYYEEARRFAQLASQVQYEGNHLDLVIVTGGGPGIMEAANRGAHEAKAKSVGLNITLPHEQDPNPYITPELCFQFHYFSLRKMHFMMRAKALVAFPGGYGTFDELFETLTLVQTGKKSPLPIVLVGKEFWSKVCDFQYLADQGMISPDDLKLFSIVETAEECWDHIQRRWRETRATPPAGTTA